MNWHYALGDYSVGNTTILSHMKTTLGNDTGVVFLYLAAGRNLAVTIYLLVDAFFA